MVFSPKSQTRLVSVPNTGNKECCMLKSLHMVLQYHGESLPLHRFIPMTAYPFGFLYSVTSRGVMPWPLGCPCLDAMTFITRQLGYDYEVITGDWESVWERAKVFIEDKKPLVAGPLPIEMYRYNPKAPARAQWDSFCVVCGYSDETIFIHDTFGLSNVPLSYEEMKSAWEKGTQLCPILPKVPFLMAVNRKVGSYNEEEVTLNALKRALSLIRGERISESMYTGILGQRRLAEDVGSHFGIPWGNKLIGITSLLRNVTFFVGAGLRADIASFLHYYAGTATEDRADILRLGDIYHRQSSLYLSALRASSFLLDSTSNEADIAASFRDIQDRIEGVVAAEEEALDCLANLFSE